MWSPLLATALIAVTPPQSGLPGLGSALPALATGCTERAHGPQLYMGCPTCLIFAPEHHQHLPFIANFSS